MPALFWESHGRMVTEGGQLVNHKIGVEDLLRQRNFVDVRRSDSEVAGVKNGVIVSIGHLPIAGLDFHEVSIAAGDDVAQTRSTLNDVVAKLKALKLFDF